MRIIKEGKKPSEETVKTCSYCKCKFAHTEKDVVHEWRDGDYVECASCNKALNIK